MTNKYGRVLFLCVIYLPFVRQINRLVWFFFFLSVLPAKKYIYRLATCGTTVYRVVPYIDLPLFLLNLSLSVFFFIFCLLLFSDDYSISCAVVNRTMLFSSSLLNYFRLILCNKITLTESDCTWKKGAGSNWRFLFASLGASPI